MILLHSNEKPEIYFCQYRHSLTVEIYLHGPAISVDTPNETQTPFVMLMTAAEYS